MSSKPGILRAIAGGAPAAGPPPAGGSFTEFFLPAEYPDGSDLSASANWTVTNVSGSGIPRIDHGHETHWTLDDNGDVLVPPASWVVDSSNVGYNRAIYATPVGDDQVFTVRALLFPDEGEVGIGKATAGVMWRQDTFAGPINGYAFCVGRDSNFDAGGAGDVMVHTWDMLKITNNVATSIGGGVISDITDPDNPVDLWSDGDPVYGQVAVNGAVFNWSVLGAEGAPVPYQVLTSGSVDTTADGARHTNGAFVGFDLNRAATHSKGQIFASRLHASW